MKVLMLLYPLAQNQPSWFDDPDISVYLGSTVIVIIILLIVFLVESRRKKKYKPKRNLDSKFLKENLEEFIKVLHNRIKGKGGFKAYKLAKSFHDKLDSGEIESQDKLDKMIENHCNSLSDLEVIKIIPQFTFIVTCVSSFLTQWNKRHDLKKINPKGYNKLESIYSLALDFHTKFGSLEERISKAKRDLNPTKDKARALRYDRGIKAPNFNDFSQIEKRTVLYHARLRALKEVMISDGENHPAEISILLKFSKRKIFTEETQLQIKESKEYKFIWGEPVDLKNRENLTIAIKSMGGSDIDAFFVELILLALSDGDFDLKEKNYIRNLYSDCKGISKKKALFWIESQKNKALFGISKFQREILKPIL